VYGCGCVEYHVIDVLLETCTATHRTTHTFFTHYVSWPRSMRNPSLCFGAPVKGSIVFFAGIFGSEEERLHRDGHSTLVQLFLVAQQEFCS
jgi:hypothetical protein